MFGTWWCPPSQSKGAMTNPAKFKNEKHFRITFHELCLFRETVLYSQQNTGISLHTKLRYLDSWIWDWISHDLVCLTHWILRYLLIVRPIDVAWFWLLSYCFISGLFVPWRLFHIWVPIMSVSMSGVFLIGKTGETYWSRKWWLWYWSRPRLCQCLRTLLGRKPNLLSGTIWSIATSSTSKGS